MTRFTRAIIVVLAAAIGAPALCIADDATVKVQGRGSRRDALDAMCYKPFDAELLGKLGPWLNGDAVGAAEIKGKPVLIVCWASWYKTSLTGLDAAQQLADKNKDLVVIAVHQQRGFDKAADALKTGKITVHAAHDAKKEFFDALRLDGAGPNFFVIDRAGNMRFADVERASVEQAVTIVSTESESDAAAAKAPASAGDAKPKSGGKPDADAYKAAKWPKHNGKGELMAKDVQGKALPVALGKETWITPKVELDGKVVVLDFWATWCGPCRAASPILDELQDQYKDKAVIVGMSGQKQPNMPEDVAAIKKYLAKNKPGYSHANDSKQGVYKSLEIQGIPHVVVMSTDGVVRWQGNPLDANFKTVLAAVVEADPGIKVGKAAGTAAKP